MLIGNQPRQKVRQGEFHRRVILQQPSEENCDGIDRRFENVITGEYNLEETLNPEPRRDEEKNLLSDVESPPVVQRSEPAEFRWL